jgi:2-amino-4-hydroxy-6-hydroxymethyldihydropteridine diphosphokinase
MDGQGGQGVSGVIAFIGVGANLGDPAAACREALCRVATAPGIRLLRRSSLYRTEPVGPQDQEWFVNGVIEVRTALGPRALLEALKGVEGAMGRREGPRWGPRVIDLDILLYGPQVVREPGLTIPHPELHRRAFVLIPLAEIASYVIHPAFGVSIQGLLGRLEDRARVEPLAGPGAAAWHRECGEG